MPALKDYRLFISHAWKYGDDYDRIIRLLDNAQYFSYMNYSSPSHKPSIPLGTTVPNSELRTAIQNKIRPVQVFIVLSGMYVAYSDWIQFEIDTAVSMRKPIIGIKLWGSEYKPTAVTSVAKEMVGWSTDSIVSAIRKYSI